MRRHELANKYNWVYSYVMFEHNVDVTSQAYEFHY